MTGLLRGGFLHARTLVVVLEQFEHFCTRQRQTLLYNLFDVAQTAGVDVCIVGTSSKMNVIDMLEKRIRSRFSMRQLCVTPSQSMEELMDVLVENLRLSPTEELTKAFLSEYESAVRVALNERRPAWEGHFMLGRSPSWFLAQCRPLQALLSEGAASKSPDTRVKRRRLLERHSSNESHEDKRWGLIGNSTEDDHVVLIAMHHIQRRKGANVNLATILYEIQMMLHQKNRGAYTVRYDEDLYRRIVERTQCAMM